MSNEACPTCGAAVEVAYGPDLRYNPPCTNPMMWRAQCSGDCCNPRQEWTRFTRDEALAAWNAGVAALSAQPKEADHV